MPLPLLTSLPKFSYEPIYKNDIRKDKIKNIFKSDK